MEKLSHSCRFPVKDLYKTQSSQKYSGSDRAASRPSFFLRGQGVVACVFPWVGVQDWNQITGSLSGE